MTPTMEVRLAALRAALDTQGNPNKLQLAREYLAFLREEDAPDRDRGRPVKIEKGQK